MSSLILFWSLFVIGIFCFQSKWLYREVSFSEEAIRSSDKEEVSGDLKEFGVDIDEPDLFNSDIEAKNSDDLLGSSEEDQEDDDLEIPAFLRRQKN